MKTQILLIALLIICSLNCSPSSDFCPNANYEVTELNFIADPDTAKTIFYIETSGAVDVIRNGRETIYIFEDYNNEDLMIRVRIDTLNTLQRI